MAKPLFVFATQRSGTNFLRYCLASDERITDLNEIFGFNVRPALFWRHRKKVLALDYGKILGLNTGVVPDCIDGMLNDLGVSVDRLTPSTVRLARSLDDTVENFDSEVKPLLQGSDLGYLLKAA